MPSGRQFVGYDPQMVRFLAFCVSGFFAGVAGGLAGIHYEIANSAYFSATQSGNVLLATFIGGSGYFFGPVIGAALVSYLQVMLSDVTEIWQLYFGLLFIVMVMFAPQGIAGLLVMHRPLWGKRALLEGDGGLRGRVGARTRASLAVARARDRDGPTACAAKAAEGPAMTFFTVTLAADRPVAWLAAGALAIGGFVLFRLTWHLVAAAWAAAEPLKKDRP